MDEFTPEPPSYSLQLLQQEQQTQQEIYHSSSPPNIPNSSPRAPPPPRPPRHQSAPIQPTHSDYASVVAGLKNLYKHKIKHLETTYNFEGFHSPCLTDSDIAAKPIVLMLGQYSVGKSSFLRYILERDYPGIHIGPEPTTDRFVAVMAGSDDQVYVLHFLIRRPAFGCSLGKKANRNDSLTPAVLPQVIPGNAAAVSNDLPFRGLNKFGTAFLSRFQVSKMPCALLENVTLIDTPGILSGDKQRLDRGYDMTDVLVHFAERADLILCCFDCHKLDISDEFKNALRALRGSEEKIRVILNKADSVSGQQLLRVYGALMWSLGKVIQNPEVMRVYIGSFWDRPLQCTETKSLLEAEQRDLLRDLRELPGNSAVRKVNEIVKRARLAKVHAFIIGHLKKEMPAVFGKNSKQVELIANLDEEFLKIQQRHHLPVGDFPNVDKFRAALKIWNFEKFSKLKPKIIEDVDNALSIDFPRLMGQFPQGTAMLGCIAGNPFEDFSPTVFAPESPMPEDYWSASSVDKTIILPRWHALKPVEGKASGAAVKAILTDTGLPNDVLSKIWKLADWGGDGYLDFDEFAVLLHLVKIKNGGIELPDRLPESLKPPVARGGARVESGRDR